jgi:hypothetical protein
MQTVPNRDERLMCILLAVAGELGARTPHCRKEARRRERGTCAGERFGEKLIELAACAVLRLAHQSVVLVGEEVGADERGVKECLKDRVEEAGLTEIE